MSSLLQTACCSCWFVPQGGPCCRGRLLQIEQQLAGIHALGYSQSASVPCKVEMSMFTFAAPATSGFDATASVLLIVSLLL